AEGATPESTGKKSDHFVGEYYVLFEKKFQEEYKAWQKTGVADSIFQERKEGIKEVKEVKNETLAKELFFKNFYKNTYFNEHSTLGKEAREMLMKWEANDPATIDLWKKM